MGLKLLLLASGCALIAMPAVAQSDEVQQGPIPAWARISEDMLVPENVSGPVFVRRADTLIHLDRKGQTTLSAYRMSVLHTNALGIGNVSIVWNPAAGQPTIHGLKIHRDGAAIDVLAKNKFQVLRREDQLEQARLDGRLTAVLQVPDLRVGDELEVAFSVPSQDPTLAGASFGLMALPAQPSSGRIRVGLSWDEGQEPTIRATPDLAPLLTRGGRAIDITGDQLRTLTPPKDAPPRYSWQRILEFSDFASWEDVSKRFAPLYRQAAKLSPNSPLKQEAAKIAAVQADPAARAAAALKLVQQQVRYIYVGLNGGNMVPASADETWERRYGDCKGKTALLLALLAELGISADPVLINSSGLDDGLDARLPNPGMFDHVEVRARIGNATYWLDGTLPTVAPPTRTPVLPAKWVLPLSGAGEKLSAVEFKPPTEPQDIALYEIDAREGFEKPAHIKQSIIKRGLEGLLDYYRYSAADQNQLEDAFRKELEGSSSWNSVESVKWRYDVPARASIMEIVGSGPVDWDEEDDGARSLVLPGGGFNPPERRQRGSDQTTGIPFYNKPDFDCRVTTVRLPQKTSMADWTYNTAFVTQIYGLSYRRKFELRDGAVRMIRSLQTEKTEIDAQTAAEGNRMLSKFDNSMAWIYYQPNSKEPRPAGPRVPATYEIDWVADSSACLVAPDAVK